MFSWGEHLLLGLFIRKNHKTIFASTIWKLLFVAEDYDKKRLFSLSKNILLNGANAIKNAIGPKVVSPTPEKKNEKTKRKQSNKLETPIQHHHYIDEYGHLWWCNG